MKACDYCGKENEDVTVFCAACGTVFAAPVPAPEPPLLNPPDLPPPPPVPRVLNGGSATLALVLFLGAQVIGGGMAGFLGTLIFGLQGGLFERGDYQRTMNTMIPLAIFLTMAFGWIAVLAIGKMFGFDVKDTSPTGAAWVRGSWSEIAKGLATGVAVSVFTMVFLAQFANREIHESGPLSHMAITPGIAQLVWALTAVVMAPPMEECLFRGILYGGYRKSLGPAAAAVLTTFIFVMLHFTELMYQPLATFGIASLALAALWRRLSSSAIGPAIAVHFGYNTVIVVVQLLAICWTSHY